ncbi:MAG: ATP-binding protein [Bacteroidia bacterium]
MPSGIKPKVNPAREFYEIANDFAEPKELLREAISNSYDAEANKVDFGFELHHRPGSYAQKMIVIKIQDDGNGMSCEKDNEEESSDLETFFNLGDSKKTDNQIGSKGHGSKIFYKSNKIEVETWHHGIKTVAETEDEFLWETLQSYKLPTYKYDSVKDKSGKGTIIKITDFKAKQREFENATLLKKYVHWNTIAGSFKNYFYPNETKSLDISIKCYHDKEPTKIPFGFKFPAEQTDLSNGTKDFCKIISSKIIDIPVDEKKTIRVEIIGAFLGEDKRKEILDDTYWNMGLWLCKDFIKIERDNEILDSIFGGEYYYRNFFILANCQQFDLTANRNNIRKNTEEYDVAIEEIKAFIKKEFKESDTWKAFFEAKKVEKDRDDRAKLEKKIEERINQLEETINNYQKRPDLKTTHPNLIIKEPRNEAETVLLLQSMISAGHPGIDFKIGGYNATYGTDLIIEKSTKGTKRIEWMEAVFSLDRLFKWSHPSQSFHGIICWEIGTFDDSVKEENGMLPMLIGKTKGRYNLNIGTDTLEVYVLKEILAAHSSENIGGMIATAKA